MPGLSVMFIGGTGIISSACSWLAVERGIDLFVLNRGRSTERPLPAAATVPPVEAPPPVNVAPPSDELPLVLPTPPLDDSPPEGTLPPAPAEPLSVPLQASDAKTPRAVNAKCKRVFMFTPHCESQKSE